ncbi:hypothetical protein CASFOL_035227 [Castilleja foliolosa]|uniref:Defensin-like protein n=1 Tax=Castilleja foliolosa TaxID=1961234 RepID=A0ABD3BS93_9LAMI
MGSSSLKMSASAIFILLMLTFFAGIVVEANTCTKEKKINKCPKDGVCTKLCSKPYNMSGYCNYPGGTKCTCLKRCGDPPVAHPNSSNLN